jgi:hypothetical protein
VVEKIGLPETPKYPLFLPEGHQPLERKEHDREEEEPTYVEQPDQIIHERL